ncbi:MAG: thiamine transporter substrate-binding protein [Clostridia bacterium]|jgi:ATP-binding cassette subfamily F protein 3|nr:thiamine transporter substrate-binding protein [Clostridia bacterium]
MIVLAGKDIKKSYGIETIIENISFTVQDNDKIGVVGVNGAGKSTLFKIITGVLEKDEGDIFFGKNIRLGYMSQDFEFQTDHTILEEMLTVFQHLIAMEKDIRQLELKISEHGKAANDAPLEQLLKNYDHLQEQYKQQRGYEYQSLARGVLKGLGFGQEDYDKKVAILSGGQKTRIALGKILLQDFDVLLLDEPTNYLDIQSVEWLEGFLRGLRGAVMIISHDRYFLDMITTKTFEVENKGLTEYNGSYSKYVELKKLRQEELLKDYELQQKEVERQKAIIDRFRQYNREKSIKQAESREKALERMELMDKPQSTPKGVKFTFEPRVKSGNDVLFVNDAAKAYDRLLFENASFEIKRGEKVALLGPNGIGKTTLLKMILGIVKTDDGNIRFGTNVNVGYYDQEQENLSQDKLVIDEIWDEHPDLNQTDLRTKLAAFLFQGEDVFKEIYKLSGGERSRISLLKLMLSKSNFLLMDEPTNHLDIVSKQVLEEALSGYNGTVLFISHDRYFINKVANKIIELNSKGCVTYKGDYNYYLSKKPIYDLQNDPTSLQEAASEQKNDWMKQKEEKSNQRKQQKRLETVEKEIERIEARIKEIGVLQLMPEVFADHVKCQELHDEDVALKQELEDLYTEWGELT